MIQRWMKSGQWRMTQRGAVCVAAALSLWSCQGQPSADPPIHLNPNMDNQEKLVAYGESRISADGAAMRTPPAGTVARGQLVTDIAYHSGVDASGDTLRQMPVAITMPLLQRGRERFNIYCSPCHGQVGDGRGIMVTRGYVPPPSFHTDRIRNMRDGEIFGVITNGVRNMPSYRHQIPVDDRWAITAYLRTLQRAHNATLNDIPLEQRDKLGTP